jgi:hypothetical protein
LGNPGRKATDSDRSHCGRSAKRQGIALKIPQGEITRGTRSTGHAYENQGRRSA